MPRYGHHGGAVLPLRAEKVKTLSCRKDEGKAEDLRGKAVAVPKQLGLKATCAAISAFFDGGFHSLTPDGEKNLPKNQVADAVGAWRSKQFAKWVDGKSPTAGLDPASSAHLIDYLDQRPDLTVITSTHNVSVVAELGSRVLLLPPRPGPLLFDGPPAGILDNQELLVASGLAHRHTHHHDGAVHAHFHVHDGD